MNGITIQGRLSQLEKRARGRFRADPGQPCICPRHGYYFISMDATPEEVKAAIPDSREYCPKCGGKYPEILIDRDDLKA